MTASGLLSLEESQKRLLALAPRMPVEARDLQQAGGRFLAEPLQALRTQPARHLSAMDGYAVVEGDLVGPWRIIGESAAGRPFVSTLSTGQTVRISTGAALPEGASHVIVQEDLLACGDWLTLTGSGPDPADKHVRRKGSDFTHGSQVLSAGQQLGPAQIALAASAGHVHLPVRCAPEVAVIDSGDELRADGFLPLDHQIPASNGIMLAHMAQSVGANVHRTGPVKDDLADLVRAFERSAQSDVIVTSGGASVGDHDLIKPALEHWGAQIDFWRVAIKPGKPILVATRERPGRAPQVVIGLPGNPVSCLVTAYLFLLPMLRRMMGAQDCTATAIKAVLAADVPATGKRREFLRGIWNGASVVPARSQDSGALHALSTSNVLIDRPAGSPGATIGDEVEVFLLQNGGIV